MSTQVSLQEPQLEEQIAIELNKCPKCGFEAPNWIIICWKCGQNLEN